MSSRGSRLQRSGLHLPDEFYEKPKYSAAKVILITRLVFTAIVRLIYGVISAIIATIYYFTLVALLEPMRHLAEPLYWYLVGLIFKKLQLIVGCWMWSGGYKVQVCGDDIADIEDEETVVLVNHQSTADVASLMYAFQFNGPALNNIVWIMDVMFKSTNFGWVSMHRGDFFIQQGKETRHLQDTFLKDHLMKVYLPRGRKWILLFPEGYFYWKLKERSQEYGRKNGFPHMEHCLLPRAGAFHTILSTLNGEGSGLNDQVRKIKWILDVTVAYPPGKPLNFQTIIFGQRDPMMVTLHYRKIPISQVPNHSLESLRDWLFGVYTEKDKLLDSFYKTGHFPVPSMRDKNYIEKPVLLKLNLATMIMLHVVFVVVTAFAGYSIWSIFGLTKYLFVNLFW